MTFIEFEGRRIPAEPGDTIASALYRHGVRVFSRSFKFHRPRGMFCGTGDCPNCSMVVDGEAAIRTCVTPAAGQRVERPNGWPSVDFDVGAGLWWMRALLPTGFYYKSMIRPKELWPIAEGPIRRLAGLGPVSDEPPTDRERRYHHPDVCVVGGGRAGLQAALAAARQGSTVVLVDEGAIGDKVPPSPIRDSVLDLAGQARGQAGLTVIERGTAVGVYEGPLVPVVAPDFLHLVLPGRVVLATGATEVPGSFEGNDLPGVWLGRAAARFAGIHRIRIGRVAVLATETDEGLTHLNELIATGVRIAAVLVPERLAPRVPSGVRTIVGARIERALASPFGGRGNRVRGVVVSSTTGIETIRCDTVVLSLGLTPRDNLARQAAAASVTVEVVGEAGGAEPAADGAPTAGFACLCEDVTVADLDLAWHEGYCGTELLKRYTTATMGPCQGAMCHRQLRAFARQSSPEPLASVPTTARPPARPVRLEDVAAGARFPLEWRTPLHDRHLEMGATMEWAGIWRRAERYGDVRGEYQAVRQRVSVMDVSTLGKYRVSGPDATEFLERLYPCHVASIKPGRSRYALVLNEAGYVFDDGLICSLGQDGYYLTFTSGGADVIESWLRDWAETWKLRVRIANQTATLGAINVCGPKARELLNALRTEPINNASLPYSGVKRLTIEGIDCLALRVGFVGELSYELHVPRRSTLALWNALLEHGARFGMAPHGLEALRLLRLEKGHIIVGQDTDFDSTPHKLGLDWAVKMDKPYFVGRTALERLAELSPNRVLRQLVFPGPEEAVPREGAQLLVGAERVGYLTSCRYSPALSQGVALGWVYRHGADFPDRMIAHDGAVQAVGQVTEGPFYDPTGGRLRA